MQETVLVPETGNRVTVPSQVRDLLPPQLFHGQGNSLPDDLNEAVSNVILTDEETATVLHNAKVQKYWALREESIKQIREKMLAEVARKWSWRDQLDYLWVRCEEMKIPAAVLSAIIRENEYAVHTLCKYFTNSSEFVKCGEGYSLQKGLYIVGYVGVGKTTLMKLFARNKKQCYIVSGCRNIQELFVQADKEAQDVVNGMIANHMEPRDIRLFFQRIMGRCFDDLGTEERPLNHYGTKRYLMSEILLGRYDSRSEEVPLHSTHVTSNINPFEIVDEQNKITRIEQEYGTRVYDRFRDMFNVIELKGDSLRG